MFLKQELNDYKKINRYTEDELALIGERLVNVACFGSRISGNV